MHSQASAPGSSTSLSFLPLFPGQAIVLRASPGRRGAAGRQEAMSWQNHSSPPCRVLLVPQLSAWLFLRSRGQLAQDQREGSPPRGRKDGVDKEGDMEPLGYTGDRAALESGEGGQESSCWSPVRALPSRLHPEPSKLSRRSW